MVTVAEYFAEELSAAGVERVYGLPGGENVEILEAIRKRGIEFVLVKSESSACFMAAAEARITGNISVALTTLGPGAANAAAGLAHAYLDRAPALLITAADDPQLRGRHSHQVIDLAAMFRPICKSTLELTPQNAARSIHDSIYAAQSNRPGPVHLSIHNNVAGQNIPEDATSAGAVADSPRRPMRLGAFQDLLAKKRKPLIVLGLGLEPARPYSQVRKLAESLRAPVIDTAKSKGALSSTHPLFAGTIGLTRDDPVYELLAEADCIIAIGFDVVELVKPWEMASPLIWIANWENQDPRIPSALELVGPVDRTLNRLAEVKGATAADWGEKRVSAFRAAQTAIALPAPQSNRILPQIFLASLRENSPDDIILTTDVGSHKIFTALNWPARQPNRYFVSNGLSAMGYGLCSAIAAAELSGKPTVCITGDAGLMMAMGELSLLAERELPVLVMVMNDAALDLIRSAQLRRRRPAYGTEFLNPDFADIASAFGLAYRRVESKAACDAAIRDGIAARAPMLIDVMIDPVGYPTTVRNP